MTLNFFQMAGKFKWPSCWTAISFILIKDLNEKRKPSEINPPFTVIHRQPDESMQINSEFTNFSHQEFPGNENSKGTSEPETIIPRLDNIESGRKGDVKKVKRFMLNTIECWKVDNYNWCRKSVNGFECWIIFYPHLMH